MYQGGFRISLAGCPQHKQTTAATTSHSRVRNNSVTTTTQQQQPNEVNTSCSSYLLRLEASPLCSALLIFNIVVPPCRPMQCTETVSSRRNDGSAAHGDEIGICFLERQISGVRHFQSRCPPIHGFYLEERAGLDPLGQSNRSDRVALPTDRPNLNQIRLEGLTFLFACFFDGLSDHVASSIIPYLISQTVRHSRLLVVPTRRNVVMPSSSLSESTDSAASARSGECNTLLPSYERLPEHC